MPSCFESAHPMFSSDVKPSSTIDSPIRLPVSRWRASACSTWASVTIPPSTRMEVRVLVGLLGLLTSRTSRLVGTKGSVAEANRKAYATAPEDPRRSSQTTQCDRVPGVERESLFDDQVANR